MHAVTYNTPAPSSYSTHNYFVYAPLPKKLAANRQLEKHLIKLEILVKNLRMRQKRLASSIAG
ncbi:hypothetical protein DV532_05065 [Pseudomonas sp. Leaf58]|nr:hypothetical protein DV532_05065 [Pseudomonas sp. Leaf58]